VTAQSASCRASSPGTGHVPTNVTAASIRCSRRAACCSASLTRTTRTAIRALRAQTPQALIIAMSGGGRVVKVDLLQAAARFGASRTLAKPFEPRALLTAVHGLLHRRGPT